MKIIINNTIYDITTFIDEHPGGKEVFGEINENEIKDMTDKFNEVGHSSYAVSLLSNYRVAELDKSDPRYKKNEVTFNENKINKLFTHEDKYNVHKILGLIVLLNYAHLFYDFAYTGFIGEISLRKVDKYFIGLTWAHALLSLSSLQFLIPRSRTGILPMIWQEFRMHSIVFALRSIIIINILYFFGKNEVTNVCRLVVVLLTMYLADIISDKLREDKKESTTATMPYWNGCSPELQNNIKFFYTYAQILATIICLFEKESYVLFIVLPIQLAAFLMTLVRKNIINTFQYHLVYSLSLLLGFIVNYKSTGFYSIYLAMFLGLVIYVLRTKLHLNKYYLWCIIFSLQYTTTTQPAKNTKQITYFVLFTLAFYLSDNLIDKTTRKESNNLVQMNDKINDDHHMITIKLANEFKFLPGQYFNLYIDTLKRPYTPISVNGNNVTFLIKSYQVQRNGVSKQICTDYVLNKTVYMKGPYGRKYYDPENDLLICNDKPIHNKNIIMFSCGTGITPFYSILSNMPETSRYNCLLNTSFRSKNDALLVDKLTNTKINLFFSEENNKLTEEKAKEIIDSFDDKVVLVCGTKSFNEMTSQITSKINIECYEW